MQGTEVYNILSTSSEFQKKFPMLYNYGAPLKPMTRRLIGREMQLRQLKAGLLRPELCNVLLLGDAGSGKAHPNNTVIAVADERGYITIGELKAGDYVYDENGNPTKVLSIHPQGKRRVFKVTFKDGTSVLCNDEHLWNVRDAHCHSEDIDNYKTMTLAEIARQGMTARGMGNYDWYVPVNKAVIREPIDLPVDSYVLGSYLGSGLHKNSCGDLEILSSDHDTVLKIADRMSDICSGTKKNDTTIGWRFLGYKTWKDNVESYITFDDVFGRLPDVINNLHIPDIYFKGSIKQRYDLLNGIMDTGGYLRMKNMAICCFGCNSKRLADDVRRLAATLGIRTTLTILPDENVFGEYNITFIMHPDDRHNLFSSAFYLNELDDYYCYEKKLVYNDMAIESIEDLCYETEMTCIYVANESHLYQVGYEHIVTHNTALVQGAMAADAERLYLEIDISKMIADLRDNNEMAVRIKALFDESAMFVRESGTEIVLFIDEFHLICMLSDAAVEALKPMLADSGTRGVRVIVATTFTEFRQYVSANQPLVQRLQRIEILPPAKEAIVEILKDFAKIYGVADVIHGDFLYEQIIELSNRYIPANSQPRKSILLLDLMTGWYRSEAGTRMDINLLYDVLKFSEGIELNVRVDAVGIKKRLDSKVFAQYLATSAVASRLQITSADLNNKTKPMGSFLFTGSTGVGKTELTKQLAEILFSDPKRLVRFDMTEYSQPESIERFRTELTTKIWERPYSVILFDEVEKACGDVTRILLQVLDDGRLIDQNNREVSFLNTYIVLTTNAASEIYETIGDYVNDENMSDEEQIKALGKYMKVIRRAIVEGTGGNRFPPELLGRIDAICPFMPLSEDTQRKILIKRMEKLKEEVERKHSLKISYDQENILRYILRDKLDTESNSGGARIVATKFEEEVVIEVARIINVIDSDKVTELSHDNIIGIRVVVEGTMAVDNKNLLEGDAYIAAYPVNIDNKIIKIRRIAS